MTTIERMALAMWRADALRELGPPVYDDIPDNLRETYLGYAKSALAALLPLDEGALKDARAKFEDARRLGWLRSGCGRGAVIRATIKAYLEHIARETEA